MAAAFQSQPTQTSSPGRHAPRQPGALVDEARISIRAGQGGKGAVSFRHEPFVPKGGPDGGDGGRGGDIVLVATTELSSLSPFLARKSFRAESGSAGAGGLKHGRGGQDLVLDVPVGTVATDEASGRALADLDRPGARAVVAEGGIGGRGNVHFKSSINRSPQTAEPGRAGQERMLVLELKLIAEAGLVGAPNAGKSSLLRAISAARPKVGDYPFTTLSAELGVAESLEGQRVVVADIPGLIEGAAQGAGLGHDFLRHVERTSAIVFVVDGAGPDPWADLQAIRHEVGTYSPKLLERPSLVVVNKVDLPEARALRARSRRKDIIFCSAKTGEGIPELLAGIAAAVRAAPVPAPIVVEQPVKLRPTRRRLEPPLILKREWGYTVAGPRVEKLVAGTDFDSEAALERFQVQLDRIGVSGALEEAGAQPGDTVRIGELEFEYQP